MNQRSYQQWFVKTILGFPSNLADLEEETIKPLGEFFSTSFSFPWSIPLRAPSTATRKTTIGLFHTTPKTIEKCRNLCSKHFLSTWLRNTNNLAVQNLIFRRSSSKTSFSNTWIKRLNRKWIMIPKEAILIQVKTNSLRNSWKNYCLRLLISKRRQRRLLNPKREPLWIKGRPNRKNLKR